MSSNAISAAPRWTTPRIASRVVCGVAESWQTVQPVHIADAADKPGLLAALADTARINRARVLAVTGSPEAQAAAETLRYADTSAGPAEAIDRLNDGKWTLPAGSLVIVDDADHLDAVQLRTLTHHAGDSNAKLVLLTHTGSTAAAGRDGQPTGRDLTDTAAEHLPWSHHLGPRPTYHTALHHAQSEHSERVRETDTATSELLHRAATMLNTYRDLHNPAHGYRAGEHDRARDRHRDHSPGLDI